MNSLVIKTTKYEETVAFFKELGLELKEEKHGKGPLHMSCVANGQLFEIYPANKNDRIQLMQVEIK